VSFLNKKILAIIPARGGSKGIIKKNLRKIAGKSLVEHAASISREIEFIDKAVISTDDPEILEEALEKGLLAPFIRPSKLATDTAKAKDVWIHAWQECEKIYREKYNLSIFLEPTSPLRIKSDILNSLKLLISDINIGSTATVSKIPGNNTPFKAHLADKQGFISYYHKEGENYSNRQSIPNFYYRNGLCYSAKREHLLESGHLFDKKCKMVLTERPVINIDEEYELELAEFFLKKYGNKFL
tara:strand:+ start:77 stop:802 length:726 start_codon:yes stop_codon:yes gene_type:complete